MMENFVIYNPVKLYFGKGVTGKIGKTASGIGKKALLVYGKGSVKENGSYQEVVSSLQAENIEIVEYSGIRPNPVVEDVDAAASLGRDENVDMVIAVGGGSVLDSAKFIAISIPVTQSCWDFATGKTKPKKALPILGVLTLAATGSEMNPFAVIQHNAEKKKIGFGHPLMFPGASFLDPAFTISVPANYTAYGIADLIAHALEGWFGEGDSTLTDRFIISIIREAMDYGPKLMENLTDYELRAKIMYAATMALNGLTAQGKKTGDWGVHGIGHCLSVLWDIPHGASLSIAFPAWMALQTQRIPGRISALGKEVFGLQTPEDTIGAFKTFFRQIGCPVSLKETGIQMNETRQNELLEVMALNKVSGMVHKLSTDDHRILVHRMI